ncbi:hypothetical protein QQF64_030903 [Cirrhinus molitorella]|uniref:Uncharacterized protein n=1 Tax=Cirrhinus molitorella TaxID=172907 RepID=A0ABR3N518_9TELE
MAEPLQSFLRSHVQEGVCCRKSVWAPGVSAWRSSQLYTLAIADTPSAQGVASQTQSAYFLPEFALSPQGSFLEDTTGEQYLTYRYDDQNVSKDVKPSQSCCLQGKGLVLQKKMPPAPVPLLACCFSPVSHLSCQKEGGYHPGLCLLRLATDGGLSLQTRGFN